MTVPYSFASRTTAIPLSELDSNFNTTITLGNTAIQLGNTVTTLNNMTLANVTISSGTINVSTGNVTVNNLTAGNATVTTDLTLSTGTANGVTYLNGSKVLTSGSALTFDGTNFATTGTASATKLIPTGGTATGNGMYLPAANSVALSTNGSESMRIDSSGNVGIGTSSPAAKLDVRPAASSAAVYGYGDRVFLNAYDPNTGGSAVDLRMWAYGNSNATNQAYVGTWSSHPLMFATGGTIRATIDSSGNVLVGGTSVYAASITSYGTAARSGGLGIRNSAGTVAGGIYTYAAGSGGGSTDIVVEGQNSLQFYTGTSPAECMRIDSSGNLLVGTTSQPSIAGVTASNSFVTNPASGRWVCGFRNATTGTPWGLAVDFSGAAPNDTASNFLYCYDSASIQRLGIRSNGGIANYSANNVNLSDRREKTNFNPAGEYLAKICAIPVQTFNYIDQNMEEDDGLTLGVVAQDVQAVAPELVSESNWGTEEEPKMRLSIYQTDLQYALMKCIQELKAELDATKAEVAALKGN